MKVKPKKKDEFDELTVKQCHTKLKADVAWLRMVYRHVKAGDKENALVYMADMIYKTLGES